MSPAISERAVRAKTQQMSQGQPRFITATGFANLRAEYEELFSIERPKLVETIAWAAANGDRSENGDYIYGRKKLREIDRRLAHLSKVMKAAKVVEPGAQGARDQVRFGATVELADDDDARRTLTIVGDDEADASAGRIGWSAPLARALVGARVGDERIVRLPAGEKSYEVVEIRYPAPERQANRVAQLLQRSVVRQVEVQRGDRHIAVRDDFQVRGMAGSLHDWRQTEPEIGVAARVLALDEPQATIIANALAADADALDLLRWKRREIHIDEAARRHFHVHDRRQRFLGPGFRRAERDGVPHALAGIGLAEGDRPALRRALPPSPPKPCPNRSRPRRGSRRD